MRDLERLLTGAYPEGLRDVPPAPVRKSAVRDKTFEKLGLERPERQPLPHEQWSQAEPVVKRRRPWAMVAACLAVVALVGAALWALPLATAPGQGQSGPLPAGTYLECSVTEAAFDEESWSMVLTAEATTDLDLDNPNAATGYGISANVAMTTDYSRISFGGLDPDTLTRWTETGENTYRCEDILVEVDPEFQMVNVLIGQLDLNLELYVGFGEQNTAGLWEDFLLADAPFTLELPMPEGSRLDFVRPNPPATYFTCQAVEAAFSQEQQALVFTLEAQTDMDLDNADCQSLYSFLYTLTFQGENGAYQYPSYDGATVDALAHWTQTGEDTYRCEGFTVPVDLALLAEQGIAGTAAGTLDLVVTDTSYVGAEDPWQFFPSVEFAVELEETSAPVSFESAQEEVYYKMLNSMDYFTTARVSFTEVLPGFHTIEVDTSTPNAPAIPDFSQETFPETYAEDNRGSGEEKVLVPWKRRGVARDNGRYSIENGDPHWLPHQRFRCRGMPAPPNVGLWPSAGERPVGYRGLPGILRPHMLRHCGHRGGQLRRPNRGRPVPDVRGPGDRHPLDAGRLERPGQRLLRDRYGNHSGRPLHLRRLRLRHEPLPGLHPRHRPFPWRHRQRRRPHGGVLRPVKQMQKSPPPGRLFSLLL